MGEEECGLAGILTHDWYSWGRASDILIVATAIHRMPVAAARIQS
jgi:hypothetical protein